MQSTLLLLASAATLAAATAPTTPIHARSLAIFRRQDTTPSTECISAAIDLISNIPTPAADVISYLATAPAAVTSDPCRITFPASLSSDVEEWLTSLSAFQSESSSALSSLAEECGGADAGDAGLSICTSEPAFVYVNGGSSGTATSPSAVETGSGAASTRSTAADETAAASDATADATASESTAAASTTAADGASAAGRVTFGAAVAVVAGVVGVVAVL
ncbi:hypothetical protein ACHAQH_008181 [Verticillium albo-atrum]